jgi:hypothetical protein
MKLSKQVRSLLVLASVAHAPTIALMRVLSASSSSASATATS